jgi:FkbM family methyltransferase
MKKILIYIFGVAISLFFKTMKFFKIPFFIKYSGKELGKFYPNGQISFGVWCGWFEKDEIDIFIRLIKKTKYFIDIGANSGLYTVIASKEMIEINKIIAFEPSIINYNLLLRNIKLNKIDSIVECYNFGLSDCESSGKLTLENTEIDGEAYIDRSTITSFSNATSDYVKLYTLDSIISKHVNKSVDFIKIDTEGYEYFILEGSKETIKSNKNIIIMFESNEDGTSRSGVSFTDIYELLISLGLKLFYRDVKNSRWILCSSILPLESNGQIWACREVSLLNL